MSIVMVMNAYSVYEVWAWMQRLCPRNSVVSLSDTLSGLGMNASDLALLLEQQSLSGCTHAAVWL